ncbi:MAG: hypothetical protein HOG52_00200, partial [Actinobacteria bacterium]|nr:hypothetical protein [Actinomycetota bacterium]
MGDGSVGERSILDGVQVSDHPRREDVFPAEATAFVADLVRTFSSRRDDLLEDRRL